MKTYHSLHHEVLVTENGIVSHVADTWSVEIAALIAELLNQNEAQKQLF